MTWLWSAKLGGLAVIFDVNLLITQQTYLKSKSSFGKERVINTQIVFEICMIEPFSSSCIVREVLKVVLCLYDVPLMLQSVAEFLKGLPSYDENNFARFHTDSGSRSCAKRPSLYLPTKDYPSEQSQFTQQSLLLVSILILRKRFTGIPYTGNLTFRNEQYSLICYYKLKFNTYKCSLLLIILNYV